jgi:hypothetical protein
VQRDTCLPAARETVALYLTDLAADHKPASLERRLTTITKAHQAAGFPTPASMQNAVVSETMKGIRRTLAPRSPAKSPCSAPIFGRCSMPSTAAYSAPATAPYGQNIHAARL